MRVLSDADIAGRLALDNPWWRSADREPDATALPRRAFFDSFFRCLTRPGPRPLVLAGPRRVGKTVLLRQAVYRLMETGVPAASIAFIAVDAPVCHGVSLERLVTLARQATAMPEPGVPEPGVPDPGGVVILDGVHRRAGWETELAGLASAFPGLRIVAATACLPRPRGEDGPATLFVLPPLAFFEYLRLTGAERDLIEPMAFGRGGRATITVVHDMAALNERFLHYLNAGGFPETVLLRPLHDDSGRLLRGVVLDALLHQDLPGIAGIGNPQELTALFALLARNIGREVSIEGLAEHGGIAKNTIRRYLDFLEAAFLIHRMDRLQPEGGRFLRMRSFRVYPACPSFHAALFGPIRADDAAFPALAATAIVGQWMASPEATRLYYARLPEGVVDLIGLVPGGDRPAWACAMPSTDQFLHGDPAIRGLIQFARLNAPLGWLGATTRSQAGLRSHGGIELWHRPAAQICYEAGRRAAEEAGG
jgi:predicted AAA+ superfamily ATPase